MNTCEDFYTALKTADVKHIITYSMYVPVSDLTPSNILTGVKVRYDIPALMINGSPSYCMVRDNIFMPFPEYYSNSANYYHSLFHEYGHATGHISRLDRNSHAMALAGKSNMVVYCKEEIVAELCAFMLMQHFNLGTKDTNEFSLAYVKRCIVNIGLYEDVSLNALQTCWTLAYQAKQWLLDNAVNSCYKASSLPVIEKISDGQGVSR